MAKKGISTNGAAASSGSDGSAARDTGMLLAVLGGTILIIYGLVQVASGIGLVSAVGLDLANIVLVGSALLVTGVGVGLQFMAGKR